MSFMDRIWQNLDKVMLFLLFLFCLGAAVWINRTDGMDEGTLDWARHNTDLVLAGLLGTMGGRMWDKFAGSTDMNHKKEPDATPRENQQ